MLRLPLAFVLFSWLAGCGLDAGNGLTLDTATDARVSGHLASPAPIDFVLERDGEHEHLVVTDYAGSPLVDATIDADGQRSTRLLAGRLVAERSRDGETAVTGDRTAEQDLAALPEAQSLAALEPELANAHIDARLFHDRATASNVTSADYLPCGSYAAQWQYVQCSTSWFGSTTLRIKNFSSTTYGSALVWFLGSKGTGYYIAKATQWGPGELDFSQWFWGSNFVIQNTGTTELQLSN